MVKLPEYPNANYEKICDILEKLSEIASSVICSRFLSTPEERGEECDQVFRDLSGKSQFSSKF
jgi:hypothetical protein